MATTVNVLPYISEICEIYRKCVAGLNQWSQMEIVSSCQFTDGFHPIPNAHISSQNVKGSQSRWCKYLHTKRYRLSHRLDFKCHQWSAAFPLLPLSLAHGQRFHHGSGHCHHLDNIYVARLSKQNSRISHRQVLPGGTRQPPRADSAQQQQGAQQ